MDSHGALISDPKPSGAALSAVALALTLALAGCDTTLGVVQGVGLTDSGTFSGISGATILSPSSVKVTWDTASQYASYQVFSSASTVPIGSTIFSSYTVTGLTPNTTYSFSVGGVAKGSTSIDGSGVSLSVQTWPQFTGVTSVTATSSSTLQASWNYPISGPTFNVYVSAGAAPTSFATPVVSTTANVIGITQLADGTPIAPSTTYYVVVRATYLDDTNEFNTNALSATTPSNIQPLPTISVDKVILGKWPAISVAGGLSTYMTSFKTATQTLGSLLGNGLFKTPTAYPISAGSNTITPTITYNGASVALPSLNVVSRNISDTMTDFPAFYAVSGPSGQLQSRGMQRLGHKMVVGDFNCDGYQDLAVAAPYGDFNPVRAGGPNDGAVYVFYGGPAGLITSPAPSATPATPTSPLLLLRPSSITGSYSGLLFGYTLAAGNLNADTNPSNGKGCDDLAIGTSTSGSINSTGNVYVFFGSPNGLQQGAAVQNSAACNNGNCSPLVIYPPPGSYNYPYPGFGYSLAIGKLHTPVGGDTYRDLLIGAPYEQVPGSGRGSAWIYYGGAAGINFVNPPTTTPPYTRIPAPNMPSTLALQYGENFGTAVAAVNLDQDAIDDVVVGAPADNTGTGCYAQGAVYYYSSVSNGGSFSATSSVTQRLTSPINPPGAGCNSYEKFGGELASAGDINGDGFADLIVTDGLPDWSWGWATFGAYVYYGGNGGPQTGNGCVTAGDNTYHGTCTLHATTSCTPNAAPNPGTCKILNLPYSNVNSGASWYANLFFISSAGANASGGQDVNGDTYSDILIGWPLNTPNASLAYLYYGSPNGLQVAPSKIKPLVAGSYDNLGWSVALGNFNGDAYADVAVSAPDNMTLNGAYGGAVFVYNGQNGGLPTNVSGSGQLVTPNLAKEGVSNGWAGPAGDLNGDGFSDAFAVVPRPASVRVNSYPYYTEYDLVIYYGSVNGLITGPVPTYSPAHPTDPTLVPAPVVGNYPSFTYAGSGGDINGDGFGDLVASDTYSAFVYFGSSSGLQLSVLPTVPPTTGLNAVIIAQQSNYMVWGDNIWGYHSNAIAAGDFNGDGFSDVALGSYPALPGGQVLVIYGSSSGPQTDGALTHTSAGGADVVLTNPCTGTIPNLTCKAQLLQGNGEGQWADSIAAVGDVNGDGYGELLVGSPYNSIVGTNDGAAYLFYGSPKGLQMWQNTNTGFVIVPPLMVPQTSRYAGTQVGWAGDINGDGFNDILISSSYDNSGWGSSGGGWVIYGCGNGMYNGPTTNGCPASGLWGFTTSAVPPLSNTVAVNAASCGSGSCQPLLFYPTGAASISGGWPGYYWGMTLSGVGDVNKDGFGDLVIGTYYNYSSCQNSNCTNYYIMSGAAVLYTGSATGLTVSQNVTSIPACNGGVCTPYWLTPSMATWGSSPHPSFYEFSFDTTVGRVSDFNGDGYPDFLISTPANMNAAQTTAFTGGFYVFQ